MWRRPLYFKDCVRLNQDIWFASGDYNGLYRYQMKEKKIERIAIFSHEAFRQESLFLRICQYKKSLIFVPQESKRLYIFNTEDMHMTDIEIPKLTPDIEPPYFCEAMVYEDSIYMMGAKYPGILRFDFQRGSFEIIDQWLKELQDEINMNRKEIFLGMRGVIEGRNIFMPCYQCNRVLEFDIATNKYRLHKVGSDENRYARLIKLHDTFVLVTHNQTDMCHVVYWNYTDGQHREIQFAMKPYIDRGIIEYLGDTWIFSLISNEICQVKDSGEVSFCAIPNTKEVEIMFMATIKGELFFSDYLTQFWYKVDSFKNVEKVCPWVKDSVSLNELEERLLGEEMPNHLLFESPCYPLEYLIKKTNIADHSYVIRKEETGRGIYRLCSVGNEE